MIRTLTLGLWIGFFLSSSAAAGSLIPRPASLKPAKSTVAVYHRRDVVWVKFRDDSPVRASNGALTDQGTRALTAEATATLARFAGGRWDAQYDVNEIRLEQLRQNAQRNLGKAVADLRTQFVFTLPAGTDPAAAIDAFNALDIVEIAEPAPQPMPLPLPPNFQANQDYIESSPIGINAIASWGAPHNTTGAGIKIADVEYSWNLNHQDLPAVTFIAGPTPVDPFGDSNHGTAVLGEMGALNNGWGTTGAAYSANLYVSAANTVNGYDVGAAIIRAANIFGPGDIILLEQQTAGPNYTGVSQFGLVPVEWVQSWYNAIVTAVGNNIMVVEAAGNGSQNLDDPVYSTGHGGHWPFLLGNDSGAIIVGAGGSPTGGSGDRSRLSFSCYGATVDLQGWGETVFTTGYGGAYSSEGLNFYYTSSFSGTSSASPIVTSACALLQSLYKAEFPGDFLTPAQVRDALVWTGSPQLNGANPATQHIGPRPNVVAAAETLIAPDVEPPDPDPMTFAGPPAESGTTSISMAATPATDATPPVEYLFQCTSAAPGGTSSFWQIGEGYVDTGLMANTEYSYRVSARDNRSTPNQTAFSSDVYVSTAIETTQGVSQGILDVTSVELVAVGTFTNLNDGLSGLYFDSLTPGGDTGLNVWVQGTMATATGLMPDTDYEFVVKARNRDGVETAFCAPIQVHTNWVSGDCNNDQVFSVESDLDCIVESLLGNETSPPGGAHRIDLNYNETTDGEDIQVIVDCLLYGGC